MQKILSDRTEEFWLYSLELYQKENVSALCLEAQDNWNADINILLLCVWLDQQNLAVAENGWPYLMSTSEETQRIILDPIRKARKEAKGTEKYNRLKRRELETEKRAQARYLKVAETYTIPQEKDTNLSRYFSFLAIGNADLEMQLRETLTKR